MSNTLRANCVVIGDSYVGKTSLVSNGPFPKNYEMTLGLNISVKTVRIPDTKYKVDIFVHDCSGKKVYADLLERMWTDATLVVVAYDVTSDRSFRASKDWYTRCIKAIQEHPILGALVACKTDLADRRTVTPAQGESMARELGLRYFECSTKEGANVDAAFFYLAHEWYKQYIDKVDLFATAHL
ncbi:intraflagellar transport protein 27 homolog [Varroa jacobsoni]|uniref:Uncharacterized protein n=1 Tax=Varroa destructor TaxID=109461 RepID=A0A7M7M9Z2_VARDE|nr:intraflagellar transport protein 27 homolog isoform X2 [Varroa destructor]XP_022698305.1 intraflagellar transport protein 27 homolog [Varroa jacobsoni]